MSKFTSVGQIQAVEEGRYHTTTTPTTTRLQTATSMDAMLVPQPPPSPSPTKSTVRTDMRAKDIKTHQLGNTVEVPAEPMAILGIACRFAGSSTSPDSFRMLLESGRDVQSGAIPKSRFDGDQWYHPDQNRPGSFAARGGYFLDGDITDLDLDVFQGLSGEAKVLDPLQRKFFEVVYECFESAGATKESLDGSNTACYVGKFNDDHLQKHLRDIDNLPPYLATASGNTLISNRVNNFWNLTGPSLTVDTACSSSLSALHLACNALQLGECDAAVVGGVNLIQSVEAHMNEAKMGALSPTSRCHTFGESADGYARGEGIAALYIKRLRDAIRDGDPIRAVIRGTAINSNGRTPGITHPSTEGQAACIRMAYRRARLNPHDTAYCEAHGTGTPTGDPIEVRAIGTVFGESRTEANPILIGSVKSNIGHTEAASGIASIIKAVLALETGIIPATIGVTKLNPMIDFDGLHCKVVTENTPFPEWPSTNTVRRISVNSFGYGGTNAHAILEAYKPRNAVQDGLHPKIELDCPDSTSSTPGSSVEYPGSFIGSASAIFSRRSSVSSAYTSEACSSIHLAHVAGNGMDHSIVNSRLESFKRMSTKTEPETGLLVFSAASNTSLMRMIEQIAQVGDGCKLRNLSYTLGAKRTHHFHRAYLVVKDGCVKESVLEEIPKMAFGKPRQKHPRLGFVFTGQGAQWAKMGVELLRYSVVRDVVRKMDEVLRRLGEERPEWTIEGCFSEEDKTFDISRVDQSQTLCTALQLCVVELFKSWGIKAQATIGHSSGEIAAAYTAGLITLQEATIVAYYRGYNSRSISPNGNGAMLAVGMSEEEADTLLPSYPGICIACVNSPVSATLSGDESSIDLLIEHLDAEKIFCKKLNTGGMAYHSPLMLRIGSNYLKALQSRLSQYTKHVSENDTIPMFSSVDPEIPLRGNLSYEYWRNNLLSSVQFSAALSEMLSSDTLAVDTLVEIGPHPALATSIKQTKEALGIKPDDVVYLSTIQQNSSSTDRLLNTVGQLFTMGHSLEWKSINTPYDGDSSAKLEVLTNMPTYRWNYSNKWWHESRVVAASQNQRPRHDVLGRLLIETDLNAPGISPMWRNHLRVKDLPWLKHHQVQGVPVFPAAGYIAMAAEALLQSVESKSETRVVPYNAGYVTISNISIKAVLTLPSDEKEGVETLFTLTPVDIVNCYDFRISSYRKETWTEHCNGRVRWNVKDNGIPELEIDAILARTENTASPKRWYQAFEKIGLKYGSSFKGLSCLKTDQNLPHAMGNTNLCPTEGMMTPSYESRYLIHPTTIDTCLQMGLIAAHNGQHYKAHQAVLPIFAEEIHIWGPPITNSGVEGIVRATAKQVGSKAIEMNSELCVETGARALRICGLKAVAIPTNIPEPLIPRHPYMRLVSKPDIDTINEQQFRDLFPWTEDPDVINSALSSIERLSLAILIQVHGYQPTWGSEDPGIRQYIDWMNGLVNGAAQESSQYWAVGKGLLGMTHREREAEIASLLSGDESPEAEALSMLHRTLPSILDGKTTSLEVLFNDNILNDIYSKGRYLGGIFTQFRPLLDLLAHKNPKMSILEIGAGTGGTTGILMEVLKGENYFRRYKEYTYTDVSAGFLSKAQERFGECRNVQFKTLDVTKGPVEQGYEEGSFDMILASNCLHATAKMDVTLSNVRKLLKPGGRLVLLEITTPCLWAKTIMGVLPQYWGGISEGRIETPFLSKEQWSTHLLRNGFSGLDLAIDDFLPPSQMQSVILSTAIVPEQSIPELSAKSNKITIVTKSRTTKFSKLLRTYFMQKGWTVKMANLQLSDYETNCRVVVLAELDTPLLASPTLSKRYWKQIQLLVARASSILWVTNGKLLTGGKEGKPELAMIGGLARSIMTENPRVSISTLDFEMDVEENPSEVCDWILKIETQLRREGLPVKDIEFKETRGTMTLQRLVPDEKLNNEFLHNHKLKGAEPVKFGSMKAPRVYIDKPGFFDTVYFAEDRTMEEELQEDQVLIRTKAVGINMQDITILSGKYDHPYLSNECSGVIELVGPKVTTLKPGDRVMALVKGHFGAFHKAQAGLCQKIRDSDTFENMASMPLIFCTAIQALTNMAHLTEEDSVLVQSGSGGVGQAAIQIAKAAGAKIFTTVGSKEKKDFLEKAYNLPSEHIFITRGADPAFIQELLAQTEDNQGVDVILTNTSGEAFYEIWKCAAPLCRIVEIGRSEVINKGKLDMSLFQSGISFSSFDMWELPLRRRQKLLKDMMKLYRVGAIRPIYPISPYYLCQFEEALLDFSKGTRIGKFIMTGYEDPEMTVKARFYPQEYKFRKDASYLIIGGLGGLGVSLSNWMVAKGAKHLVYLNRSGADKPAAAQAVRDLRRKGVSVQAFKGDVSNMDDVRRTIRDAGLPIRGVVQASMVLKDTLYDIMTLKEFQTGTSQKVAGTINLHNAFVELGESHPPLDFFITTSSGAGVVGTATQANYNSSNNFQDYFARYRRGLGLPATCISLGMILDAGHVAEHPEAEEALTRVGLYPIAEHEFHDMMQASMLDIEHQTDESNKLDPGSKVHIVTGLETHTMVAMTAAGFKGSVGLVIDPRFGQIFQDPEDNHSATPDCSAASRLSTPGAKLRYLKTLPAEEAIKEMARFFCDRIAMLMFIPREQISPHRAIITCGVDSMVSADLRNWVWREFKMELSFFEILSEGYTIEALAARLLGRKGCEQQKPVRCEEGCS